MHKSEDPAAQTLMEIVSEEVKFAYAIWKKDYLAALDTAVAISDTLGGPETAAYRAWWHYLAGSTAWLAGREQEDRELLEKARSFFGRAAHASKSVSWFAELSREVDPAVQPLATDVYTISACEGIFEVMSSLGFHGQRFGRKMEELQDLIGSVQSGSFERGLELLGKLLGFDSSRPSEQESAPDSVWLLTDQLAIVFEAKSEEKPDSAISMNSVRQSNTHRNWVLNNCHVSTGAEVITVLVSPRTSIEENASQNAEDLYYAHVGQMKDLAETLEAALRRIRSQASEADRELTIDTIREELDRVDLLPARMLEGLRSKPLHSLPISP
jgi:hypothetical protein